MAYEKQTWATGDTVTSEKLNHMEAGILSGQLPLVTGTDKYKTLQVNTNGVWTVGGYTAWFYGTVTVGTGTKTMDKSGTTILGKIQDGVPCYAEETRTIDGVSNVKVYFPILGYARNVSPPRYWVYVYNFLDNQIETYYATSNSANLVYTEEGDL